MQGIQFVVAAVGLAFEGRIAGGPGVVVLGRGNEEGLAPSIEKASRNGCRGLISFGIAGGLAPHLRPGAWIVGSTVAEVAGGGRQWPTSPQWSAKLLQALPGAVHAPVAGVDAPVAQPAVKRLLHEKTGAAICDMESHVAARLAAAHGLAFAVLRVVADPAHRALPNAALAGMRDDGRTNPAAVLRALALRPASLSALISTAIDAAAARASLQRVRRLVGPSFGLSDCELIPLPRPEAAAQWAELRGVESQTV